VLDALIADVAARAPDHIAVTGDLTNFSTPQEYAAARAWLETLGDPASVTVSPGNHDALVRGGAPEGFAPWAPWLGDGEAGFPHLRLRGPVAIVNLSSAVATPPHKRHRPAGPRPDRRGRGPAPPGRGQFPCGPIHHPPAPGLVSRRKSLTDGADPARGAGAGGLRTHPARSLARALAELVAARRAQSRCSASIRLQLRPASRIAPARWNEIAVVRDGARFRAEVSVRGVTEDLRFVDLGRYGLA
jgi:3',5'-cyclic AMP phosphodiesterase CpdA